MEATESVESVVESKKKKKSKNKESVSGVETSSVKQANEAVVNGEVTKKKQKAKKIDAKKDSAAKVFEESDWDIPLKEGEQELVLPNKKYKGKEKLEPPAAEPSIPGFEPA